MRVFGGWERVFVKVIFEVIILWNIGDVVYKNNVFDLNRRCCMVE